jgi:phosphoribosylformylglycinamidine synthase subunit PurL
MSEACIALDMPIVSGNVSLYNESKATGGGSAILPTPAIGAIGLLKDWSKSATIGFKAEGDWIVLLNPARGDLGQSLWLREILGREEGPPPTVNLDVERHYGRLVQELIADEIVNAVHDISDGGLLVTVTEMALASSKGATLSPIGAPWTNWDQCITSTLFAEGQGSYILTLDGSGLPDAETALIYLKQLGLDSEAILIGKVMGGSIDILSHASIPLATLRTAHEGFFPALMGKTA